MPNIFIVIPTFNEEKNISQVLTELLPSPYQIVVVDDGSVDATFSLSQKFPIAVLHHLINRGQGAALSTGTAYALKKGADIIVHFDGDGQFLTTEISSLIMPLLEHQADIVLGSRFLNQKPINMPWFKKKIIHPLSKLINNFITGVKLTDVHCGLRALNRLAAEKIIISQDGMAHNTEIIAQIKKHHLRYEEKPITVIYHQFGQGISGGIKILKELIINKIINF